MAEFSKQYDGITNDLLEYLNNKDVKEDDLYEMVIDACNNISENVNNCGLRSQIEFLDRQGYSATDILSRLGLL